MIEESRQKKVRGEPGFDMEAYQKQMSAKFPELSDPRCYTHSMTPVPMEHMFALYDSKAKLPNWKVVYSKYNYIIDNSDTEGRGTREYLKLRWSVPPKERYYFPVPVSWDYGWHKPEPNTDPYYGHASVIYMNV